MMNYYDGLLHVTLKKKPPDNYPVKTEVFVLVIDLNLFRDHLKAERDGIMARKFFCIKYALNIFHV